MTSPNGIEELPWDTRFFGARIGRAAVTESTAADIRGLARSAGFECLYLFVPADQVALVERLIELGAVLVDIRAELDAKPPDGGWQSPHGVRRARTSELSNLRLAAEALSELSRFAADPHFERARIGEMYDLWLERCFSEGSVIVPVEGGPSFVGARATGDAVRIELVYVDPEQRGRDLGRRLILGALAATAAAHALVVVRVGNVAALRLYQALGFRTRSAESVLHLWLR